MLTCRALKGHRAKGAPPWVYLCPSLLKFCASASNSLTVSTLIITTLCFWLENQIFYKNLNHCHSAVRAVITFSHSIQSRP